MENYQSFFQKNRLTVKAVFIGILTLLLLIPTAFIAMLVEDRQSRHEEAVKEVSGKWAASQIISGPVLVIPYRVVRQDDQGHRVTETRQAYFLPDSLQVTGTIDPKKRHRGIYPVIVYRSDLRLSGTFTLPDGTGHRRDWLTDQAFLMMGIKDMRGIENRLALSWNGVSKDFIPGLPANDVLTEGVYVPLSLAGKMTDSGAFRFSSRLQLRGSGSLQVAPVGKNTTVQLASTWPSPGFSGSFLPASYQVNDKGFHAKWTIFNLNRNLPQHWTGGHYDVKAAAFGVDLVIPVDMYRKTMRCVKYAILIIALTFTVFFLMETSSGKPVHPVQYILTGLALCLFYTLLMSLSEYLGFNVAYAIAALAVCGLVTLYASWVFRRGKMAGITAVALLILYGFIYTLVQMQDLSLLVGSLGLFLMLGLLMYYTRRINRADSGALDGGSEIIG
jgi:inner membrane protein